jgi:transcriptional regulator with XRE-family HTH domain
MVDNPDRHPIERRFGAELSAERTALTVHDEIGFALRSDRRRHGLDQRTYAQRRGLSRTMLARLEAGDARMSIGTVTRALTSTGFRLTVAREPPEPTETSGPNPDEQRDPDEPAPAAEVPKRDRRHRTLSGLHPIEPAEWDATDLVARVRSGSRRFPAHRQVRLARTPPPWWWMHEFFEGLGPEPTWYAPVHPLPVGRPHPGEGSGQDRTRRAGSGEPSSTRARALGRTSHETSRENLTDDATAGHHAATWPTR